MRVSLNAWIYYHGCRNLSSLFLSFPKLFFDGRFWVFLESRSPDLGYQQSPQLLYLRPHPVPIHAGRDSFAFSPPPGRKLWCCRRRDRRQAIVHRTIAFDCSSPTFDIIKKRSPLTGQPLFWYAGRDSNP